MVGSFFIILTRLTRLLNFFCLDVYFFDFTIDVHCGVVGNIQAFHVCAPGSIPGDGVFIFTRPYANLLYPTVPLYWIPTIAQLVERRTVVYHRFP